VRERTSDRKKSPSRGRFMGGWVGKPNVLPTYLWMAGEFRQYSRRGLFKGKTTYGRKRKGVRLLKRKGAGNSGRRSSGGERGGKT